MSAGSRSSTSEVSYTSVYGLFSLFFYFLFFFISVAASLPGPSACCNCQYIYYFNLASVGELS